jgi:hypothetical protein
MKLVEAKFYRQPRSILECIPSLMFAALNASYALTMTAPLTIGQISYSNQRVYPQKLQDEGL